MRNVANALREGGRVVLDYLNVFHAEAHLVPDELVRRGDVAYHRMTRVLHDDRVLQRARS